MGDALENPSGKNRTNGQLAAGSFFKILAITANDNDFGRESQLKKLNRYLFIFGGGKPQCAELIHLHSLACCDSD